MKKDQNLTWDDVKAMFAENARQAKDDRRQAKEDRRQAKEDYARWKKEMKESDRKQKEDYARWKKEMKESDRKQKEENVLWKKAMKESDEKAKRKREENFKDWEEGRNKEMWAYLKELGREVGGIAHSNGEMAEEYFYNAFRRNMTFVDETFDSIKRNLSYNDGNLEAEFDLVLFNGKSAALIEIKYNAKPDNIEIDTLISRVEVFRVLFPQYAHYNIYLGVAAMSFKKDLVWRLHRAGIATIRPIGKKMVVYDKKVKVF